MYDTITTERNFRGDFRFWQKNVNLLVRIYLFFLGFFSIIFKFVSSSTIYDFLDQKFHILYVYVPKNNVSRTLAEFFSINSYR